MAIKLTLRASVEGVLWAEPVAIDFGELTPSRVSTMRVVVRSRTSGLASRYIGFSTLLDNSTVELVEERDKSLVFDVSIAGDGRERLVVDLIELNFKSSSGENDISKAWVRIRGSRR